MDQYVLVERLGLLHRHQLLGAVLAGRAHNRREARLGHLDELVEQDAALALVGAAVAREQRALHHLGQVTQPKDRRVQIGALGVEQHLAAAGRDGDIDILSASLIVGMTGNSSASMPLIWPCVMLT